LAKTIVLSTAAARYLLALLEAEWSAIGAALDL
jgi:hypothetical protein